MKPLVSPVISMKTIFAKSIYYTICVLYTCFSAAVTGFSVLSQPSRRVAAAHVVPPCLCRDEPLFLRNICRSANTLLVQGCTGL